MPTTKCTLALAALVIAGAVTTLVIQNQTQTKLREENQSLRRQITQLEADNAGLSDRFTRAKRARAPRLPAPPMPVSTSPNAAPTEDSQPTGPYALFQGKELKLTAGQVEPYLKANRRNAASLLAAYRSTGNPALLAEAMQHYPDDPQVAFEAVFKADASPEQRRQWLDAFKQSAPDNSLANYLSALDYFKSGQTDQAVQELIAASGKPQFQDYSLDRIQGDVEAYLAAGYPAAEAKTAAMSQLTVPQLAQLKGLAENIVDLAKSYRQAGDETSAQAALQMAADLGRRYGGYGEAFAGEAEVTQFVGMAVERIALSAMDPNSSYGDNGQTVQDRLNQLAQNKAALKELWLQAEPLLQRLTGQDWISYTDRSMLFGEEAALRWVVGKYGQND